MKIVLLQDVAKLGVTGDIVSVADGYARNFIIPGKLGLPASQANEKIASHRKRQQEAKVRKLTDDARTMAERLQHISCTVRVRTGVDDKLYGAVTPADIAAALTNEGLEIDKKKITCEEPIQALGVFTVKIKLHPGVEAPLKVWVVKE